MKGTIQEIVGQESGLLFEDGYCWLMNWSSNLKEYNHNRKDSYTIKNVLIWLIRNRWIRFDEDSPVKKYMVEGYDVGLEDFDRGGVMYRLTTDEGKEFWVLTISGWN